MLITTNDGLFQLEDFTDRSYQQGNHGFRHAQQKKMSPHPLVETFLAGSLKAVDLSSVGMGMTLNDQWDNVVVYMVADFSSHFNYQALSCINLWSLMNRKNTFRDDP